MHPLFPVHAGVIPEDYTSGKCPYALPRTRGGHPLVWFDASQTVISSPYTRGSSLSELEPKPLTALFPVHAGVIPQRIEDALMGVALPRTRGGHPLENPRDILRSSSSPYTRGSSQSMVETQTLVSLFPVHAGVIPP